MKALLHAIVPSITENAASTFLATHLKSVNLLRNTTHGVSASDTSFGSNEAFWEAVLNHKAKPLSWISLQDFQLCDWFPRSPGLYHTPGALAQRERAERYVVEEKGVLHYRPEGKTGLVAGGLGSVRFRPIKIDGDDNWMCTATSDQYCHSGIPLAVPNDLFSRIDLEKSGIFQIRGRIKFLPPLFDEVFRHYIRIPQIYVHVSELRQTSITDIPVIITPMVFFESDNEDLNQHGVTYVQCASRSYHDELEPISEWISNYVDRYGSRIITNFDEQQPAFENAPFSLQSVMTNRLDGRSFQKLHIQHAQIFQSEIEKIQTEKVDMTTSISLTLGDGTVIHGDLVVAKSIENSFNRAANSSSPDELKATLQQLAIAVGKLTEDLDKQSAEEIARDLAALTDEASSAAPRRDRWQQSIEDITTVAKKAASLGIPVLEIASKLTSLLP